MKTKLVVLLNWIKEFKFEIIVVITTLLLAILMEYGFRPKPYTVEQKIETGTLITLIRDGNCFAITLTIDDIDANTPDTLACYRLRCAKETVKRLKARDDKFNIQHEEYLKEVKKQTDRIKKSMKNCN